MKLTATRGASRTNVPLTFSLKVTSATRTPASFTRTSQPRARPSLTFTPTSNEPVHLPSVHTRSPLQVFSSRQAQPDSPAAHDLPPLSSPHAAVARLKPASNRARA